MALVFPHREKDQSRAIFSGFAGFLAVLLTTLIFYSLWNWNKWKKQRESFDCPKWRHTRIHHLAWHSRPSLFSRHKLCSLLFFPDTLAIVSLLSLSHAPERLSANQSSTWQVIALRHLCPPFATTPYLPTCFFSQSSGSNGIGQV